MAYRIDSTTTANTLNFNTDANIDCTSLAFYTPDPLIDWLPNSCLYVKYVPTWHLVKSYGPHDDLTNQEILDVLEGQGYFK